MKFNMFSIKPILGHFGKVRHSRLFASDELIMLFRGSKKCDTVDVLHLNKSRHRHDAFSLSFIHSIVAAACR